MRVAALLRGVMPTGRNHIPNMRELTKAVQQAGFGNVQTYLHSGNLLLDTSLGKRETADCIHRVIYEYIGADLSIIIKKRDELRIAAEQNPFGETYDTSRIHLVFTNDAISQERLAALAEMPLDGEEFSPGSACLYLYLPRDAAKKKINNTVLERKLGIVATTRKLNVVQRLYDRMNG